MKCVSTRCQNEAAPDHAKCESCLAANRRWKSTAQESTRAYRDRIRSEVFLAYGGVCACCGENEPRFLMIDHVDGIPESHRYKSGKRMKGSDLYLVVRREGFPATCQLLCFNCNNAKAIHGVCPHAEVPVLVVAVA